MIKRFIFLATFSVFLIIESSRAWVASMYVDERDLDSSAVSLSIDSGDAVLNYRIARISHVLSLNKLGNSVDYYLQSISLNPTFPRPWLGISEVMYDLGEVEDAKTALTRARELSPMSSALLWDSSLLALRMGFNDYALTNLKLVAKYDIERRKKVYDLSWEVIDEGDEILEAVISDEILSDYLDYLKYEKKVDEVIVVWNRMDELEPHSEKQALDFIQYLMQRGMVDNAYKMWTDVYDRSGYSGGVWNGSFEDDITSSAFGWNISKTEGVYLSLDDRIYYEGNYSLKLEFDTDFNMDFKHVSQMIPVSPDTDYVFSSYVSTKNLMSINGITWELNCGGVVSYTESLLGTNSWKNVSLRFHTPPNCSMLKIVLRRLISKGPDRFIKGIVWIDNVELQKAI